MIDGPLALLNDIKVKSGAYVIAARALGVHFCHISTWECGGREYNGVFMT